jgi:hypothetical protein
MAIKPKEARQHSRIVIDLTGPDGNAFCLMGTAKNLAKQLDKDWEKITEEMRAGDYEHLLAVFDREFGDYVDLQR